MRNVLKKLFIIAIPLVILVSVAIAFGAWGDPDGVIPE